MRKAMQEKTGEREPSCNISPFTLIAFGYIVTGLF
jgi:hypothetical protein